MSEWEKERERASRFKFDFYEQSWAYICAITGFRRRSAGILSENANSSPFTREMRYASKISLFFSFFREPLLSNGVWMVCPRVQERKIFFLPLFFRFASRHMIKIFDEANHDLSSVHNSFTIVNKTFSVIFYSFHISYPYSSLSGFFYISSSIFTSS